jgi:class 3 adenylate cyclase
MEQEQSGRVGRRLAAIVAADVAGYSRLMGLDEVGTARTLREHRKVTDALVAKHGGRIVKTTGDGVLLEFPSVVDAVECALAVQAVMDRRNEGVPQDRRMLYRIGINLGDILIEGEDILGDGVNVAARLEGIAEPGVVSAAMNHQSSANRGRLQAAFCCACPHRELAGQGCRTYINRNSGRRVYWAVLATPSNQANRRNKPGLTGLDRRNPTKRKMLRRGLRMSLPRW